jgi:superfamily II DNA or RNA helicase
VAQADLPQLARYLLELLPANLLPLPVELPLQEIAGEPTPVLRLWGRAQSGVVMSLFARLEFDYQGVRTAPMIALEQAFSLHWQDGEEYRIQHDAAAETAAMAQLVALEFEPVAATDERQLDVHFPMADDAQQALRWKLFIDQALPELEQQGWLIEYGADFRLNVVQPSQWQSKLDDSSGEHWFDLALSIQVGEQEVQLLPLLTNLLEQLGRHTDPLALLDEMGSIMIALEPGLWLQLPAAQLRPVVAILIELYDGLQPGDKGQIQLPRAQAASLNALELALQEQAITLQFQGGEKIRELGQKLTQFDGIKTVEVPANLQAELRPYQQTGLDWLQFLREYGFGGILADDMGLGKTVQTLAHILIEKNAGRLDQPVLVIAPTSVVSNWRREAERFAPQLRVLVLHGSQRKKAFERIDEHDMVLSTYPLLTRDHKALQQQRFHSIILDEAQYIKNAKAKTTQIVNQLRAEHRLCLTGTPLENNLSELWSQFNFLMPGFLSDASRFTRLFRSPIEKERDRGRQRELNRRIKPFILRRTKQQVASELPPKTEIIQRIQLGQEQALLYESIRVAMEQRVRELLQDRGLARSRIAILDALLKLRQACCDPRLVKLPTAAKVKQSAKLAWLMEMLPELLAEGRRVLIFSQFVTMLTLIEAELNQAGIDYSKLTGRTRKRDDAIALFQDGGVPVFLISLKAGGVGLNLTAADTVIVYDPWWNPATEQQAIDRAYRIGQDKPVFVYKLIAEQSVEEKILILQQRKQALADALYEDGENGHMPLNAEELLQLFQPLSAG